MKKTPLDRLYNKKEGDHSLIGRKVVKSSGRPFKSGSKDATISGYTFHERTKKLSFTFLEDDSYVECFRCSLID